MFSPIKKRALLPLLLLTTTACAAMPDGGIASDKMEMREPIIVTGIAPPTPEPLVMKRITSPEELQRLGGLYHFPPQQMQQAEQAAGDLWLLIPPRQSSGGYQLRIQPGQDGGATACLQPPSRAATTVMSRPAFLLALPKDGGDLSWREEGCTTDPVVHD